MLKCSHEPYVNAEIFLDSIKTVFLAYLDGLRRSAGFSEQDAVLLTGNCSAHLTDDVINLLT
jgi:hypothetical protein